jgi:hypothetical protein
MAGALEAVTAVARASVAAPPSPRSAQTRRDPSADLAPAVEAAPHPTVPTQPPPPVRVEVSLTAGVQTVTIYDTSSGRPIYQSPPEHTRQVLDRAVAGPQRGGRGVSQR